MASQEEVIVNLTNVWVNIAGSPSTPVLSGASGTYNSGTELIFAKGGALANGGPVKRGQYVIGADQISTKYDWSCYAADPHNMFFSFSPDAAHSS